MTTLLSKDEIRVIVNDQRASCLVRPRQDPTFCLSHGQDVLYCITLAVARAQRDLEDENYNTSYTDNSNCQDCGSGFSEGVCSECHERELDRQFDELSEPRILGI